MSTISWVILFAESIESITAASGVFMLLAGIATVLLIMGAIDTHDADNKKTLHRWSIFSAVVFLVCTATVVFIPSKKAVYMVAGVEVVNRLAHTETAKEIGEEGIGLIKDISSMIHSYAVDAIKENTTSNKNTKKEDK